MSNWLKPLDYFFLTRPILFFPGWATLLVGTIAARGDVRIVSSLFNSTFSIELWNSRLFFGLVLFACAMGGSFVLNQLQDIESDKSNNKLFLFGDGFISKRAGYIESVLLLLTSLLGAVFLSPAFFGMVLIFNFITGYSYNFFPFAFKDKPIGGLFANMAMGWLAFAMGWVLFKPLSLELLIASLPFLFFNTSLYFLTTLPDVDGDRASDKVTFPVKYGLTFTVALCLFFFILAGGLALWHKNDYMLVVFLLTAPFMVRLAMVRKTASAIIAVKVGIASFALLACVYFPIFLLVLGVIFFFTRFYYRNRFEFDYPNFKGR